MLLNVDLYIGAITCIKIRRDDEEVSCRLYNILYNYYVLFSVLLPLLMGRVSYGI